MDMDIRDRLSLEEYVEISDRCKTSSNDYESWYIKGWCVGRFNRMEADSWSVYRKEIYALEEYKKRIRLLQEALDV